MNFGQRVTIGLYRHFKGEYYYVTGLSKSATDEKTVLVNYFNVCHPEYGTCTRPIDDFITEYDDKAQCLISNRKDNITGQHTRFARIKDINFQLGSVSTEQLIEELRRRVDSPIHELDIEGLRSKVFCKDYIIGEAFEATEDTPRGVYTVARFDNSLQAMQYMSTHPHKKLAKIFKRIFIEEK